MFGTLALRRAWWAALAIAALAIALAVALPSMMARGADHLDAPLVMEDGRVDINDVYAFQSPTNPDNTVLIMTVNPLAGMASPTAFHPSARYEFLIDDDGNAKPDRRIFVAFSQERNGEQRVVVVGNGGIFGLGKTGQDVRLLRGGMLHAGLFDDPFFFDLVAFRNVLAGAGTLPRNPDSEVNGVDFFAGANVSAIVLEIPTKQLKSSRNDDDDAEDEMMNGSDSNIGVWARTALKGKRVDRMGRPAINTVFIPSANKDAFNMGEPRDDREDFGGDVTSALLTLSGLDGSGYTQEQAEAIKDILLPDILTIDTASSAGFLNGRRLADDVIDAELPIATGGLFGGSPVLTTDEVPGNDVPYLSTFPYLAPPH